MKNARSISPAGEAEPLSFAPSPSKLSVLSATFSWAMCQRVRSLVDALGCALVAILILCGVAGTLPLALRWCEEHSAGSVRELLATGREAAFVEALELKPMKRSALLRALSWTQP